MAVITFHDALGYGAQKLNLDLNTDSSTYVFFIADADPMYGVQQRLDNFDSFVLSGIKGINVAQLLYASGGTWVTTQNFIYGNEGTVVASILDHYVNTPRTDVLSPGLFQGLLSGDDQIEGNRFADFLEGQWGNDVITGNGGNDIIDGGPGTDTINFSGDRSEYNLTKLADGYQIEEKVSGRDGTDTVRNAEILQFADMTVDLTMASKAASINAPDLKTLEELYVGFFNRIPEAAGLSGWIDQIKNGVTLKSVADQFYEFGVLFGVYDKNMSDSEFIAEIYANVLGREGANAPTKEEIAGWESWLHTGANTKGAMVLEMLEVSHGLFTGHPEVGWVIDLLDNKAEVANYFAVQQGLSYNTPQENIDHGTAIAAAITPNSTAAAIALIGVNEFNLSDNLVG